MPAERKPNAYGASSKLQPYAVRAVLAGLVRVERQVDALEALELFEPVGMQAGTGDRKPGDLPLAQSQAKSRP